MSTELTYEVLMQWDKNDLAEYILNLQAKYEDKQIIYMNLKVRIMRQVVVTFKTNLSTSKVSNILEDMFWDGEYFEDFEDVDWEITN